VVPAALLNDRDRLGFPIDLRPLQEALSQAKTARHGEAPQVAVRGDLRWRAYSQLGWTAWTNVDRYTTARSERPNDCLRQNPVDWDGPITEVRALMPAARWQQNLWAVEARKGARPADGSAPTPVAPSAHRANPNVGTNSAGQRQRGPQTTKNDKHRHFFKSANCKSLAIDRHLLLLLCTDL
jgi:hypothetical protein